MKTVSDSSAKGSLPIPAIVLLFLILSCIAQSAYAAEYGSNQAADSPANTTALNVYFFYGNGCIHCENIRPYIDELAVRYPGLKIQYLEVYNNATNRDLFSRMMAANGIATAGVPALFIGTTVFIGETQIRELAEPKIIELEQAGALANPTQTIASPNGSAACPATTGGITLPLVISCALIDSVNPCAFAVLVFLLLSIITLQSRRRVLMIGGVYIAAVFIFYLLSGIGLFAVIQGSGFSQVLFIGAAVLSILLGLVNITDVIRKNEGFILAIPESKKEVIERYVSTASLPAAFVLGILVGIFELPCTGGIYLAILSLIGKTLTFQAGLPYLILYNFIFVLPLIVILLVVAFGLSPERVNSWRLENRRLLRLAIGIAMIAIGAVMLSGIL